MVDLIVSLSYAILTDWRSHAVQICDYWQTHEARGEPREIKVQMQVYVPRLGYRYCYLDTQDMSMRYQSPQETITYGNLARTYTVYNTIS